MHKGLRYKYLNPLCILNRHVISMSEWGGFVVWSEEKSYRRDKRIG